MASNERTFKISYVENGNDLPVWVFYSSARCSEDAYDDAVEAFERQKVYQPTQSNGHWKIECLTKPNDNHIW